MHFWIIIYIVELKRWSRLLLFFFLLIKWIQRINTSGLVRGVKHITPEEADKLLQQKEIEVFFTFTHSLIKLDTKADA
jgi:hypothetical protein